MCALDRTSMYILLSIMINLAGSTFSFFLALNGSFGHGKKHEVIVEWLCVAVPLALLILAHLFDHEDHMDVEVESGLLNVARHSFRCNIRFASMT